MHPAQILAYVPVDNYMNQHQNVAMYVALAFLALLVGGLIRLATR